VCFSTLFLLFSVFSSVSWFAKEAWHLAYKEVLTLYGMGYDMLLMKSGLAWRAHAGSLAYVILVEHARAWQS
jgi:hypothetical protein